MSDTIKDPSPDAHGSTEETAQLAPSDALPPAASSSSPASAPAPEPISSKSAVKPPAASVEDASDSEDDRPSSASTSKGKGKEVDQGAAGKESSTSTTGTSHDWQAVWSPPQNAYYFYNTKTMETTWTNPLASTSTASSAPPDQASREESPPWDPSVETLPTASAATALAPFHHPQQSTHRSFSYGQPSHTIPGPSQIPNAGSGIDPALAHLLPSYNPLNPSSSSSTSYSNQARFNAKTGKFESDPSRVPEHLSDYARMKRQNEAFFDQTAWEREREAEFERAQEEGGGKRKRTTKEEVAYYKAKKEAKRKKNNAWLRS